jgi:hypothetical protein
MSKQLIRLLMYFAVTTLPFVQTSLAQQLEIIPFNKSATYELGETAGWRIENKSGKSAPGMECSYTVKKNNFDLIKAGKLEFSSGKATVAARIDEPAMLFLEVTPAVDVRNTGRPIVAGATVAPTKIKPCAARPADFDAFWQSKIKLLHEIPEKLILTPKQSEKADVEYATVQMDHINGAHIHGQIAKPNRTGKFPALVIFQWASPPYPLQKQWVTDRAAEG